MNILKFIDSYTHKHKDEALIFPREPIKLKASFTWPDNPYVYVFLMETILELVFFCHFVDYKHFIILFINTVYYIAA